MHHQRFQRPAGPTRPAKAPKGDGLRSRIMAPVYALIISLTISALMMVVLQPRDSAEDPKLRFVKSVSNAPATELNGSMVSIIRSARDSAAMQVDANGEILLDEVPAGPFDVCTRLPDGWTALGTRGSGQSRCWFRITPGKDIPLVVTGPGR